MVAMTCLPIWMPFTKVPLRQEDMSSGPVPGMAQPRNPRMEQEVNNGTGRRKLSDQ